MANRLVILPQAARDIEDAHRWYEEQRPGLGAEFLEEIDRCFGVILLYPEMHAVVHEEYRRALTRRFPYAIFYEHEEEAVTIHAVFHTARDPGKWRRRLS